MLNKLHSHKEMSGKGGWSDESIDMDSQDLPQQIVGTSSTICWNHKVSRIAVVR